MRNCYCTTHLTPCFATFSLPSCFAGVRSLLLWSMKSHDVDLSLFCLLLYLWSVKPRSHWKIPSEQLSSFTLEKDCTICPWKFPETRPGIFGRTASKVILFSQIYPRNSDLSQPRKIYSLNSAIPSFRNRIYSADKVIPAICTFIPGIALFLLSGTGPSNATDKPSSSFRKLWAQRFWQRSH